MTDQSMPREFFVARLLRDEGLDPTKYDVKGIADSLVSICPENHLSNLSEVDQEWVDLTVSQFVLV